MPSPFPGMDPYLEDPGRWPDVHHRLISDIQDALIQYLRPKYYVMVEERIYISDDDDPGRAVLIPALRIPQRRRKKVGLSTSKATGRTPITDPIVRYTLQEEEIHEARLAVIYRATRSTVTCIEVLRPSNKVAGSRGRANYEDQRLEVKDSRRHFVEIDLLRAGVPIPHDEDRPPGHYFVHVSRVQEHPEGQFWPISLREKLPVVPIPLKSGDADAPLDLQAVLDGAYDRAAYDLDTDYRRPPIVALSPDDAKWASQLLRRKGLR